MTKQAEKIAQQIKDLVDQLATMSKGQTPSRKQFRGRKPSTGKKGAAGAISVLMEEGFFDTPQDFPAVIARLEQIGRYYPKSTVAMNLLNLSKRRTLSRIKDSKTKKWRYVFSI